MVWFFFMILIFSFLLMIGIMLYIIKYTGNWKVWIPISTGTSFIFLDLLLLVYINNRQAVVLPPGISLFIFLSGILAVSLVIVGVYSLLPVYKVFKESREELTLERNRARQYLDVAGVIIVVLNREGNITLINKRGCELLEYSEEELIGKNWFDFVLPSELVSAVRDIFNKVMQGELKNTEYYENEIITGSGERRFIAWHNSLLYDKDNRIFGTLSSGEDITARSRAEKLLLNALKERETLIKELYHRTKNNMQIISSMLNLQAGFYDDDRLKEAFEEAVDRIHSMAMVHEKLYSTNDLSRINLKDYIIDLLELLKNSYTMQEQDVVVKTDLEDLYVTVDKAIPLGLIINEIITNSYKYAFSSMKNGEISVSLTAEDSTVRLSISDDGVGLPEDFIIEESKSFGMQTIIILGENQLGGKVTPGQGDKGRGVHWCIEFINEDQGEK